MSRVPGDGQGIEILRQANAISTQRALRMAAQHASTLLFVRLLLLPYAHAATCLRSLNVQPVYGLVEKTPRDLLMMRNFGQKSDGGMTPLLRRRVVTFGPDHEPLWVRLYVQKIDRVWAAMIVAGEALPPPGRTS